MKRASATPKPGREVVLEISKLKDAAEVRFVVSNYYQEQEARKRADMQLRHIGDKAADDLAGFLTYTSNSHAVLENQVKSMLGKYAETDPVGQWMLAQFGVGPVLAAGFLAHLDIEQAPTAGHFWSFAGLMPKDVKPWVKGEKRPYNAALKQLCFHLGECFKRSSNSPDSFYGKIYRSRKAYVVEKNDRGDYAERAKTFVTKSADVKKTLAGGKLPDGNLDRQAANFAAKIFLSHLHAVMFWHRYGKAPPKPFGIAILSHAHEIKIPFAEMFAGFPEAYYGTPAKVRVLEVVE